MDVRSWTFILFFCFCGNAAVLTVARHHQGGEGDQLSSEGPAPRRGRSASPDHFLVLGLMNGTAERRLYEIKHFKHAAPRARLIGSVKDDEAPLYYPGHCLMAVDEKNNIAWMLNLTHALGMSLENGEVIAAVRKDRAQWSNYQIIFWNETDTYNLQGVETHMQEGQNFSVTCWSRLVETNNTEFSAECRAQMPYNIHPRACVFQQETTNQHLWLTSPSYYADQQVILVAAQVNASEQYVSIAWAGGTGINDTDELNSRDCFARDVIAEKSFGVTRQPASNTSQQLIEILKANISGLQPIVPPPEHVLDLPEGLLLDSNGACSYDTDQSTFYLMMSGQTSASKEQFGEHTAPDSSFHGLVVLNTKTHDIQLKPLQDLPANFVALQTLITSL